MRVKILFFRVAGIFILLLGTLILLFNIIGIVFFSEITSALPQQGKDLLCNSFIQSNFAGVCVFSLFASFCLFFISYIEFTSFLLTANLLKASSEKALSPLKKLPLANARFYHKYADFSFLFLSVPAVLFSVAALILSSDGVSSFLRYSLVILTFLLCALALFYVCRCKFHTIASLYDLSLNRAASAEKLTPTHIFSLRLFSISLGVVCFITLCETVLLCAILYSPLKAHFGALCSSEILIIFSILSLCFILISIAYLILCLTLAKLADSAVNNE